MFFEFLDLLLFFWFLGFPRILLLDSSDLSDSSGFFNIFSDSFEICRFLLKSIGFSHILPDSFGSSRIFLVLLAISSDFFRFSAVLSDVLRIVSDSLKFFGFFRTLWDSFRFIRSLSDSFEWFQIFFLSDSHGSLEVGWISPCFQNLIAFSHIPSYSVGFFSYSFEFPLRTVYDSPRFSQIIFEISWILSDPFKFFKILSDCIVFSRNLFSFFHISSDFSEFSLIFLEFRRILSYSFKSFVYCFRFSQILIYSFRFFSYSFESCNLSGPLHIVSDSPRFSQIIFEFFKILTDSVVFSRFS